LARLLRPAARAETGGLDVLSLGPGEGSKEVMVLSQLLTSQARWGDPFAWISLALVDVSIPLLLTATKVAHQAAAQGAADEAADGEFPVAILPIAADFEEGSLRFVERLPSARSGVSGRRLVMLLGNVFGNLRHEERFLHQRLFRMVRPGDLVWLEVGLRLKNLEDDPLYQMSKAGHKPTAAFSNRIRLLEGPYRRWEVAIGRTPTELETRIWVREDDDSCPVPRSINFCHDLVIKSERRVCTMLYSRRYEREALCQWLESNGFAIESVSAQSDSRGIQRAVHILARRT
jgi:hypothetical protein